MKVCAGLYGVMSGILLWRKGCSTSILLSSRGERAPSILFILFMSLKSIIGKWLRRESAQYLRGKEDFVDGGSDELVIGVTISVMEVLDVAETVGAIPRGEAEEVVEAGEVEAETCTELPFGVCISVDTIDGGCGRDNGGIVSIDGSGTCEW